MTPRVLVLYGTTDGHTAKIADAIARALRAAGADAEIVNAEASWDPSPDDFSAVIVAASLHAGKYQRPVLRWVARHAEALATQPTAFVSVCLAVLNRTPKVDRDIRANTERFFAKAGWRPVETKVVAGALRYTKYGWLKRWMMRLIVAKQGGDTDTTRDYEYTDWRDLEEFVARFSASFLAAPMAVARG